MVLGVAVVAVRFDETGHGVSAISVLGWAVGCLSAVRNRLLELPALISKCEREIERKSARRISIRRFLRKDPLLYNVECSARDPI